MLLHILYSCGLFHMTLLEQLFLYLFFILHLVNLHWLIYQFTPFKMKCEVQMPWNRFHALTFLRTQQDSTGYGIRGTVQDQLREQELVIYDRFDSEQWVAIQKYSL